jgi:hypothetical protein
MGMDDLSQLKQTPELKQWKQSEKDFHKYFYANENHNEAVDIRTRFPKNYTDIANAIYNGNVVEIPTINYHT